MAEVVDNIRGYLKRYDAFLIPVKDPNNASLGNASLSSVISSAAISAAPFAIMGSLGLSGVLQLEQDKGNVITAHRVDGGYALTQRGGKNDDRVFIRLMLTGKWRFLFKEILAFYADNKSVPLMFLSREVRLAKCQIESFKLIANSERRQALIIHLIFRQLRSFQDNIYATVLNLALTVGTQWMAEEDLYDNAQTVGVSSISWTALSTTINFVTKAKNGRGNGG